MARTIEYTQVRPTGDSITRNITGVNETLADATISSFVGEISDLSANTLTAITKVDTEDIATLPAGSIYTTTNKTLNYVNTIAGAYIYGANLNDTITNTADNVTIDSGNGADSITNSGENVSIYAAASGMTSIVNSGAYATVSSPFNSGGVASANSCYLYNTGQQSKLYFRSGGHDLMINEADYCTLDGGNGNDTIKNWGDYCLLAGNGSSDTIENYGNNVTISPLFGVDVLNLGSDNSVTISCQFMTGNASNPSLHDYNPEKHLLQYTAGNWNIAHTVDSDHTYIKASDPSQHYKDFNVKIYGATTGDIVRMQFGDASEFNYTIS